MTPLRLGFAAPVFAAPGHPMMRTPSVQALNWADLRRSIEAAEALGYDSVWFSDHLFHGRDGAFFESWTTMSIAAGFTTRVRLVNNHLGIGYRDARIVAKMATTLAAASEGRFDLFMGKGYRQRENRTYGLGWEGDDLRTARLGEAVDLVKSLWSGGVTDFEGWYYSVENAVAAPSHGATPFIWLGGPLDGVTEDMIAHKADGWNSFPMGLDAYRDAAARIGAACERAGRDPHTLRRSLETQVLVLDSPAQWNEWLERWRQLRETTPLGEHASDLVPPEDALRDDAVTAICRDSFIVGTRAEVADRITAFREAGVTDLVCWFMDQPAHTSMAALIELLPDAVPMP